MKSKRINETRDKSKGETRDKSKGEAKDKSKGETRDKSKGETRDKSKGEAKDKSINGMKVKTKSRAVQKESLPKIIIGIAATVVLVMIIVMAVKYWRKSAEEEAQVNAGIRYLEELEKQDMEEISGNIKSVRDANLLNLPDMDESAVWAAFDALNVVILGDSRAIGFSHWEYVAEERVLASGGGKITDIDEELDRIKEINPEHVFLCFGLNDVGIGFWPEAGDYAAVCDEKIRLLEEELPNATIYLNSILPAVGVGLERDSDYPRIGEYNDALRAMCEEKGYHFVDNTQVAEEHVDLYADDGLHVGEGFYKYWAANMLTEVD